MINQLHILTGEYPPQSGGVADYTRLVADALVNRGVDVHIWVLNQCDDGDRLQSSGPTVHREPNLGRIGRQLDQFPADRRILVQYAPNAFSTKGLNVSLGPWLAGRKSLSDRIRLMFHEVTYILRPGDGLKRGLLVFGQRRIARGLLKAADAVDVAIPYWENLLRPLDPTSGRIYGCRPVPSNVPIVADLEGVSAIRREWTRLGVSSVIGSFGTFATDVEAMLATLVLPALKTRANLGMILIGRGSERTADRWLREHPEVVGRIKATGACDSAQVSRHLQAADLLVQPYPGGVCGKRGSLMAGIAHGRPTLTTTGLVTEPLWSEAGAAALCDESDLRQARPMLDALLDDPEALSRLGRAGQALYDSQFDLRHTVEALTCPETWTF